MPEDSPEAAALSLMEMNDRLVHARALQTAAELGIGDLLEDGPRTAAELASATSTRTGELYRLLRLLTASGVLAQTEPDGPFSLTALGGPLSSAHPFSVHAHLALGSLLLSSLSSWTHSLRTGEPSFPQVTGKPFFDYLAENPEHGAMFHASMENMSLAVLPGLIGSYDFSAARRIVDVGGGNGTLMRAVLDAAPQAEGIVFDEPQLTDIAREKIRGAGLDERCTVVGGDFFDKVPEGGDLYLLKWIVHDWPDERAAEILRNCRAAMAKGGRVVLIEMVVPPGPEPHPSKSIDLILLSLLGGMERSEEQFTSLLGDSGLRLRRIVPTPTPYSFIEAEAV